MNNILQINDEVTIIGTEHLSLDVRYSGIKGKIISRAPDTNALASRWTGPSGSWWNVQVEISLGEHTRKVNDSFHELELIKVCRKSNVT